MTSEEWESCDDPARMLGWVETPASLNGRAWSEWAPSARKLRLFYEAILETDEFAWCGPLVRDLEANRLRVRVTWNGSNGESDNYAFNKQQESWIAHILRDILGNVFSPVTLPVGERCGDCGDRPAWQETYCQTCKNTRHGPSPVLTPTVVGLAEAAYRDRCEDGTLDREILAVLSDALEEAGLEGEPCDDMRCLVRSRIGMGRPDDCRLCKGTGRQPHPLLDHLRGPGPCYRGCWAIDLLTGRS